MLLATAPDLALGEEEEEETMAGIAEASVDEVRVSSCPCAPTPAPAGSLLLLANSVHTWHHTAPRQRSSRPNPSPSARTMVSGWCFPSWLQFGPFITTQPAVTTTSDVAFISDVHVASPEFKIACVRISVRVCYSYVRFWV